MLPYTLLDTALLLGGVGALSLAIGADGLGVPVVRALKSIGEREPFLTDGAGPNGETVTLWRHGVELVLEGSFSELDAYLAALKARHKARIKPAAAALAGSAPER